MYIGDNLAALIQYQDCRETRYRNIIVLVLPSTNSETNIYNGLFNSYCNALVHDELSGNEIEYFQARTLNILPNTQLL